MSDLYSSTSLPSLADILKDNPGWLDEAVNETEASRILDVPVPTLRTQRVRGGPNAIPFVKLGKSVRYIRRVLFERLRARSRLSTSDSGAEAA